VPERDQPIRITHCLEYAAVRLAAFLFRALPLPAAVGLGRGLGAAFHRLDGRHRERVVSQVLTAFQGEFTDADARRVAREMYRHLGTMLVEFIRVPMLAREALPLMVDWGGHDRTIAAIVDRGKGAIFATGHIGNWEMSGGVFHQMGFMDGAIARPLDNPLLDAYVYRIRRSHGQQIWEKFGALRPVLRALREGRGIGILVDQDAGQRGVFVPFFGRPASTMPTPADLALHTGAPLVPCAFQRLDRPLHYRFTMREPLYADPESDPAAERLRLLEGMNQGLEGIIREAPAQWLWLHRRWKTQPRRAE